MINRFPLSPVFLKRYYLFIPRYIKLYPLNKYRHIIRRLVCLPILHILLHYFPLNKIIIYKIWTISQQIGVKVLDFLLNIYYNVPVLSYYGLFWGGCYEK